jgi:DNA invertase Pin-like site-specific DNA recombinase
MIQRHYKAQLAYKVVIYARMSDKKQNKRSPEQQIASVQEKMQRCGCPWTIVRIYRDDGIKGRYLRRRVGLQHLLRDIQAGLIQIDLIVVDTFERFGRAEEFEGIRRKLMVEHGVLIVSADTEFADPTGMTGKAIGMVEQVRSTEDGRIKAHNVVRGKKDAIRLGRWPGGPVPLGLRLKKIVDNAGSEPDLYSLPEPDPDSDWIVVKVFQKAFETGWAGTRLARWLNPDASIPAKFKPFSNSTINYILANEIYIGVYVWGALNTDIINDCRVVEANPHPEEVLRVEGFCRPIIERTIFEAVRSMRERRAAAFAIVRAAAATAAGDAGGTEGCKLIQPMAAGISIKYAWAGMVRCAICKASMVPHTSGRRSKAGTTYTYYVCPRHIDSACSNAQHVREQQLARAAADRLRVRLFPRPASLGTIPDWFAPLIEQVGKDLAARRRSQPAQAQVMRSEVDQLNEKTNGWMISLGSPKLPATVRQQVTEQYERALARIAELESCLEMELAMERQFQTVLDPRRVLDGLGRLDEVLAAGNTTLLNLELAKHVERIDVYPNGRVMMRGTYLGVFEGGVELLSAPTEDGDGSPAARRLAQEHSDDNPGSNVPPCDRSTVYAPVEPRRLTPRRVDSLAAPDGIRRDALIDGAMRALDPKRFAGLSPALHWEEKFTIGAEPCWAVANAAAVLQHASEHPRLTWPERAKHFGVSIPTVRKALKLGHKEAGTEFKPRTLAPRGVLEHREIADESARLYLDEKLTIRQIAKLKGVNQVTVSKALDHWYKRQGLDRPDGRATRKIRVKPTAGTSASPPADCADSCPVQVSTNESSQG